MLPLDVKHRWMFVAILFFGIFVKNSESSDINDTCGQMNLLFVSPMKNGSIQSDNYLVSGTLCLVDKQIKTEAECCRKEDFNCSFEIKGNNNGYSVTLNEETLSKQDTVFMTKDGNDVLCNKTSDLFLTIHKCLTSDQKNYKLGQNSLCGKSPYYDEDACYGLAETDYIFTVHNQEGNCVSCKKPPLISLPLPEGNNGSDISLSNAVNIMNNLPSLLEQLSNFSTASITIGHIKGMITKLPPENQTSITFAIKPSGDMNPFWNNDSVMSFPRLVQIPKEASVMAKKRNGSFAAALLFPGMHQDDPNSFFLNHEIVGIEMGTEVSNLSHTIDIHYRGVDKKGMNASCRSWDGKGKEAIWITDGCQIQETSDSITCQCSHLTFFAILLSTPPGNISTSDFKSLTYITSIGCGLSMFFLTVALFMFCLMSKGKASQATKILMNLFVAMFTLNLSFLVNESIAELGNFGACVAMAAVMHYAMLATFSWFFMEALHLYLNLWKLPTDTKRYMTKICVTGWVIPAVVVISLLASRQYDYMVINTNDGNSAKMCWIPDAVVHQGVNVGYYAVVFIFTFVIFIMTVRHIVLFKATTGKGQDNSSVKTNSISILGLLFLLGITWAVAFFSYGPLLVPSYYIFTILNSFQGFFLFIYYFQSRKIVGAEKKGETSAVSSSSTATSNTVVTSPN